MLEHWDIPFRSTYDYPEKDRKYPHITIEYEYEELVDLIAKKGLK